MNAPAVSVVMPAYDAAPFIADAIRSVLAQTFTDFELPIADDGSTDATAAIARQASAGDVRVRILDVPHGGPARARNAAIGDYGGTFSSPPSPIGVIPHEFSGQSLSRS